MKGGKDMREQLKQQLRDMIATLGRAEGILDSRSKKKDEEAVKQLLEDMQNSAMAIGTAIEAEEGLETETVGYLEEYCELLWQYMTAEELKERFRIGRELAGKRGEISSCLEKEAEGRIEVVFLLCKADKWKFMERLWSVARENPLYDCRVLVAPYSEGLEACVTGMLHDEMSLLPEAAGSIEYDSYNMEEMKPDIVFMDGPYGGNDELGLVPGYDFEEIREHAGVVIYMPFYENESYVKKADCQLPQVRDADMVIVPSDEIREIYIENLRGMEDGAKVIRKVYAAENVDGMVRKVLKV